jgi:hypothetical protein
VVVAVNVILVLRYAVPLATVRVVSKKVFVVVGLRGKWQESDRLRG